MPIVDGPQVQRVVSLNPQGYNLKSTSKIDLLQYLKGLFEN